MDRYDLVTHRWNDGVIDNETGIEYFVDDLLVDHLNTLTRELAAANAKIEEAPHQLGCDSQRLPRPGPGGVLVRMPCNCWKSED